MASRMGRTKSIRQFSDDSLVWGGWMYHNPKKKSEKTEKKSEKRRFNKVRAYPASLTLHDRRCNRMLQRLCTTREIVNMSICKYQCLVWGNLAGDSGNNKDVAITGPTQFTHKKMHQHRDVFYALIVRFPCPSRGVSPPIIVCRLSPLRRKCSLLHQKFIKALITPVELCIVSFIEMKVIWMTENLCRQVFLVCACMYCIAKYLVWPISSSVITYTDRWSISLFFRLTIPIHQI